MAQVINILEGEILAVNHIVERIPCLAECLVINDALFI